MNLNIREESSITMIKKGIINWIIVIIILVIFAFTVILFRLILDKTQELTTPLYNQMNSNTSIDIMNQGARTFNGFDVGFAILFFGLGIVSIFGTSSLLATTRAFIPFFLIFLLIAILLSVVLANFYIAYVTSPGIAATAEHYPIINFIFSKFPFFVMAVGIAIMVGTYAKTRGQNEIGL